MHHRSRFRGSRAAGRSARSRWALAAAALALIGFAPAESIAAAPLVGEWHLDSKHVDGGNDVLDDTAGGGHHLLAPAGSVLLDSTATKFGGALTTSSNAALKTVGAGPAPAKLTLMAWIKQSGDPGTLKYIAGRGDDGPSICLGSSYALYSGYPGHAGLSFYVRTKTGGAPATVMTDAASNAVVFDNQWHLVTGTFDGFDAKLYVDGTLINSQPSTSTQIEYALGGGDTFNVDAYGQSGCGATNFPGRIDEVRVYDRALTGTEIGRLATATGPTPPALVPDATATPTAAPTPPPALTPEPAATPTPDRRVQANVAPVPSVATLPGQTALDASGSQNAAAYNWDLGGDGETDVSCPASQPVINVSTGSAGTKPVTVTAAPPAGSGLSAATASTGLKLPGSGLTATKKTVASAARTRAGSATSAAKLGVPDVAVCRESTQQFIQGTGGKLLTPTEAGICANMTVIWELARASGCFKLLETPERTPAAERAILDKYYLSAQFSGTAMAICKQVGNGKVTQQDCENAKRWFGLKWDGYISTGTVDLNGIRINPDPGRVVIVFPKLKRIVSAGAKVTWGGWIVKRGEVDMNFANSEKGNVIFTNADAGAKRCACGSSRVATFDPKATPGGVTSLGGFPIEGQIYLDLVGTGVDGERKTQAQFSLELPKQFSSTGISPTKWMTIDGAPGAPPKLDTLTFDMPSLDFGAFALTDVKFRFAAAGHIDGNPNLLCERNEWRVQAKIKVIGALLDLAPNPPSNGIGFCDGEFRYAGAQFYIPDPKPQLFPGVQLNKIGFGVQLKPFVARGDVGVDIVGLAGLDGTLLLTLPTPSQPFTLTQADAGATLATYAGRKFTAPTVMVGGALTIAFPGIGNVEIAHGAGFYEYPDHIAARADVKTGIPLIKIEAYVSVEALIGKGKFSSSFGGKACIRGIKKACLGADGNITSKGIVACLNIFDTLHPGAGLNWADGEIELWPIDGCKPSHYWITFGREQLRDGQGHRLAAGDALSFSVDKGEGVKNVRIDAQTGGASAPKIKVTAPGGEVLTIDGDDWVRSEHMAGVRYDDEHRSVYVGVKNGPVGEYKVERVGDSVPLGKLAETRDEDSTVEASVSGSARASSARVATAARAGTGTQVLRYDAGAKGEGNEVQFLEQTSQGALLQDLGTVKGGPGELRFTPAMGGAGKRQIVAQRVVDGVPAKPFVVTTYTVGAPLPLPAPSKVSVRRKGKSALVVSWTKVSGADQYGITLKLKGGEQRQFTVKPGQRSLTIQDVPAWATGTARVIAHGGPLKDWGKARTSSRFAAKGLEPTVFQSKSRNEKKGNF